MALDKATIAKTYLNKRYLYILSYVFFVSYLSINTGIYSDEFTIINNLKSIGSCRVFDSRPILYITHLIPYYLALNSNFFIISILKILYNLVSIYLVYKFFSLYLDKRNAILTSFLFVFYLSHDSTTYVLLGHYLVLSIAFYLFSFYLAFFSRMFEAFLVALIASFISYGSFPVAFSLSLLFVLNKEYKKGSVILIPNILYILYFIIMTILSSTNSSKFSESLTLTIVIKQFMLQIITFTEAMIGPSMWLKIYYSFSQLSIISWFIGGFLIILFYFTPSGESNKPNSKLLICFFVMTILSFIMFSFTGRYPQLTFNLGNRVTVYGSLLLTYLIVLMPLSKSMKTIVFAVMIFTILGISNHWKMWNAHQQVVISNIKNNQALKNYSDDRVIYVSGNQYSKYGKISHIEFLSENWVVSSVFKLALERDDISAISINKRHKYIDGSLIDAKYNVKTKIDDHINVYDSEKDKLFRLDVVEINSYIDSLPPDTRHWIQMLDRENFIKKIILYLMPRLEYAL